MMEITKQLYVTDRDAWRAWLEKNYDTEKEIWLIYYKKHTGKPRIPYDDAVEEALCFGWIDSTIKRIDDEKYSQKFAPRKNKSNWPDLNKKRAKKMIREGRMTKAGLAKIREAKRNGNWSESPQTQKELAIPPEIKKASMSNRKVWENFNNFAPSYIQEEKHLYKFSFPLLKENCHEERNKNL